MAVRIAVCRSFDPWVHSFTATSCALVSRVSAQPRSRPPASSHHVVRDALAVPCAFSPRRDWDMHRHGQSGSRMHCNVADEVLHVFFTRTFFTRLLL